MAVPALPDWPNSDSTLLNGIVAAISARSKAFRKKVRDFHIEIKTDHQPDSEYKRLNLKLNSWHPRPDRLTFVFWDDGTLWVDARQSSKSGWQYEFSFYGDFTEIKPEDIRDMIECSMWITNRDELQAVWRRCKPYAE